MQGFGGVLEPHMRGVKKGYGDPNRPHDAHEAGSWRAAGRFNMR